MQHTLGYNVSIPVIILFAQSLRIDGTYKRMRISATTLELE